MPHAIKTQLWNETTKPSCSFVKEFQASSAGGLGFSQGERQVGAGLWSVLGVSQTPQAGKLILLGAQKSDCSQHQKWQQCGLYF